MPAPVLQFKRGNAGIAGTIPALRPGEPAISLNNFDFFVGIDTSVANNKFFGSHRYWGREDGTKSLRLKLVDKNGSNSINIKAPDTLVGIATYTLPATPVDGYFLKTNSFGDLSWEQVVSDFNIAADSGSVDNVSTGSTITFIGGTNINTVVSDNAITINLDDNINVSGITTINSLFVNDGSLFGGNVQINNNLTVNGNVTVGGTTVTLRGQDVFIENKDIILGYTTSITPNDDTANHAGVAIASTIGTPLTSFSSTGINTLPDTYKQLMWFKSGTLGFSTDAFAFNYGVAIGTTTMADGVRLAVGSSITMTDTSISAPNFYGTFNGDVIGSVIGIASTSIRATTVDTTSTSTNTNYHLVFTDNATSTDGATMRVDAGIYYNPSSNYLFSSLFVGDVAAGTIKAADTTTAMTLANGTGNVTFNGDIQIGGNDIKASDGSTSITLSGTNVILPGNLTVSGAITGTATTSIRSESVDVVGVATNQNYYITLVDGAGNSKFVGVDAELLYNPNLNILSVPQVIIGAGVGVTQFSSSVSVASSTSSVPTSSAIINYLNSQVGNIDLTLGIDADTGGPSTVTTSQTLTISGTPNEVNTSVSAQTITVGLPEDVIVGTSLSSPTIRTSLIKSSNTGATALTLTSSDVIVANDLTVNGNLYVEGSTTQVNTTSLTVEDRTIELGRIASSLTQPTNTTWDLAVLFNYGDGAVKKAGLVWEASGVTKRFQFTTDIDPGSDGSDSQTNLPQFSVTDFAPIEISELWINNSCTGGAQQVIGCVGSELNLQNITIDAGSF